MLADKMKSDRAAFMDEIKNILGAVQTGVDEEINILAKKVEEQTNEFTSGSDDVRELQKKVLELETRESDAMWREKERK